MGCSALPGHLVNGSVTGEPPGVVHVIRPEPDGSIGGADLHVLELAATQSELGLCRPFVMAPGHGADFRRRAEALRISIRSARELVRDGGIALVHAHGYEADLIGLMLAEVRRIVGRRPPVVMTCHGIIEPDLRHRLLNAMDRTCLRRADLLIGVSTAAARQLRRIAPDRPVHLIRNGVRGPLPVPVEVVRRVRREFGAGDGDRLVGYIGRLSREKRPDLFLDVAAQLATGQATVKFVLVGGGTLAAEAAAASARSPAGARIVLAGLRHDMDAVFAALDVLVVPSDVENTPRVVLEALARAVPLVVTGVGDMPLMVRDVADAVVAPPGDVLAVAAGVTQLLTARPALVRGQADCPRADGAIEVMARAVHESYGTVLRPGPAGRRRT
jgi:glycosyltransferase involved in cell wall biosynthesis